MIMIYFFEDEIFRIEKYLYNKKDIIKIFTNCENVESYKAQITNDDFVFFHNSFSDYNVEEAKRELKYKYFIDFSGGQDSFFIRDKIVKINANIMYENLDFFIESQNIFVLGYGKNYITNQLLKMQYKIWNIIFDKKDIDNETIEILIKIIKDNLPAFELEEAKNKLLQWLDGKSKISTKILKEQISKMIILYE
jgi:hypothetical protein